MTPEQLERAQAYASDRPLRGVGLTPSTEPLIRAPERWAELRDQLMGEKEKPSALPSSGNSAGR